jgi:hypothetical protein
VARRWLALAAYTAAIYGFLPLGPRVGMAIGRTALGGWLLGPGIILLTAAATGALGLVLVRRAAPLRAYTMLLGAGIGYVLAFSWLSGQHLERTHLPEYGIAACLAWWALGGVMPGTVSRYVAAAALAAAIGYGDELLQRVVPGRVYDLRDVAMNAVGAVLGTLVLAATRTRSRPSASAVPTAASIAKY